MTPSGRRWRSSFSLFALVLAVAILVTAGPLPASADGPTQQRRETTLTELALQNAALPPRDRNELAVRLGGVTAIPTPPATPARLYQVGDSQAFWVDDVDADRKFQVDATLRYANDRVYMWVEADVEVDVAALQRSADTFAEHTYPTIHAAFGSEWSPGIDGDPRIYILHARGLGNSVAAYFAADSENPPQAVPTSNAHEMFFVNLDTMASQIGTQPYDAVLTHEFQHMVHWANDANEDSWLNEGASELAALLAGFDDRGFAANFLQQPRTQLDAWPENASHLAHYGASFMFATYFHERFGDEATRALVSNLENGFASVDDTLRALNITDQATGQPVQGEDVFADWVVANLVQDTSVADGRYGYALLDPYLPAIQLTEEITAYPHATSGATLPQYSADYLRLEHTGPGQVTFTFNGTSQVRLVPVDDRDGQFVWYSNRGDDSDSTLTHAFDLRGLKSVTLEYDVWYDIEHLWDYGYLMVSADDGATWDVIAAPGTSADDPHGNAYGPGYTGSSGSDQFGPVGWLREQVDLSAYAGREVLVRFEMITDEATNQPGMVIDDVSIPELGYSENFEKGSGGWDAAGWVYIDNVLTQRWIVQAVRRSGGTIEVTRLLGPDDDPNGTWTFDVGGPAGDVTIVISPLAPVTTESALYDYSVTRVE